MSDRGSVDAVMYAGAVLSLAFLIAPILMLFPLSVEPGIVLRFPPTGFSMRWYAAYFAEGAWIRSTALSLGVAAVAAAVATLLGTAAALGLRQVPGSKAVNAILISPMLLPTIVVSIAIYGVYAKLGLVGSPIGISLAHAILGIPFVVLNVGAALRAVPSALDDAALGLGATRFNAIIFVTFPLIWRGIAAGAVFAFVLSFDEVVIAKFLSSSTNATLPKRMLDGIFFDLTPLLAAVSVVLVLFNIILVVIGLRFSTRAVAKKSGTSQYPGMEKSCSNPTSCSSVPTN